MSKLFLLRNKLALTDILPVPLQVTFSEPPSSPKLVILSLLVGLAENKRPQCRSAQKQDLEVP